MKKHRRLYTLLGLLVWSVLLVNNTVFATNSLDDEVTVNDREYNLLDYVDPVILYDNFEINIREENIVDFVETIFVYLPDPITYYYFSIPLTYDKSSSILPYRLDVDFTDVSYYQYCSTDQCGTVYSDYTESVSDGEKFIDIGKAGRRVSGLYVYKLNYSVKRSIFNADGYDEFYWDLITPFSEVQVEYVKASITSDYTPERAKCITGGYGSTNNDCSVEMVENGVEVSSVEDINPYNGFTVVIDYPYNTVSKLSVWDNFKYNVLPYLGICMPFPVLIIVFLIWYYKGKDEKPHGVIPVYRPSKELTALLAAYVSKMKLDFKDISATIIQLAIKGYLQINQISKNKYEFIKRKDSSLWKDLFPYEKIVLQGLFGEDGEKDKSDILSLQKSFYIYSEKAKRELKRYVVKKLKYFNSDPASKVGCFIFGWFMIIGIITLVMVGVTYSPFFIIGGIISAIIVIPFGIYMGKRSKLGTKCYKEVLGLKLYIDIAEEERIKFHNDPTKVKTSEIFEGLLPYAMVFNLEKKWAKEFEGIYVTPPDWYTGTDMNQFNSYYLAKSMMNMSKSVGKISYNPNRSRGSFASSGRSGFSSGGSVGGGFGGGSRGFR